MTMTDDEKVLATFHWVAGRDGWESPTGYPLSLCFGEVGDRSIGFETDKDGSSLMTREGIIDSPTRAQVIAAEKAASDEKVLCVDVASVRGIIEGPWSNDVKLSMLLKMKQYLNRKTPNDDGPPVEKDDRWKQLIPYIVVVNKDGQILAHNRGSKGGEKRLENLWAIGFGGHVNDQDTTFQTGIMREIREELSGLDVDVLAWAHPDDDDDRGLIHGPIGFINDDSNNVGRHHLGVVYVLRADEATPREVKDFGWYHPHEFELAPMLWDERLESWSVLALPMVREFLKGGA